MASTSLQVIDRSMECAGNIDGKPIWKHSWFKGYFSEGKTNVWISFFMLLIEC